MRKLVCFSFALFVFASQLLAVVARPKSSLFHQPNGELLESLLKGDEFFHYRKTTDNYVLLPNAEGFLTYAQKDALGELVSSSVVAHNVTERTADELNFLKTIQPNLAFGASLKTRIIASRVQKSTLNKHKVLMRSGVPNTGATKFLVILVNFSDNSFTVPTTQARYVEQFNGVNYTTDGATGSVKQYFKDNSLGKFDPTFNVYGPVKLSKAMSYYGGNDANGSDLHPDEMVFEACQLLDGQINFADYDANNDGEVDNVYVIYAGYGEASGAPANTIWPHQWAVSNTTKLDGKTIGSYSCSNELDGTSGSTIDGVGTSCHEFSHATGLPDFYDTDYEVNGQSVDLDSWDVMASGCYNNAGKTPPYYTSIERELLGWAVPTELNTAANLTLATVETNQFYKISTKTPNEYFLVENRQKKGWDSYLYGHGMLIYHIDKTSTYATRWTDNTLNAYSAHQCADLVEADGIADITSASNIAADPFPGTSNVTQFTDASSPTSKSWANVATGKPITSITESNGIISFKFMGGESVFGAFAASSATDVTSTSFTANWSAATGATKYLLNVYKKTTTSGGGSPITETEGFSNVTPDGGGKLITSATYLTGWSVSSQSTSRQIYTTATNFGASSPSFALTTTGDFIQTKIYSSSITSLSFWAKQQSGSTSSTLIEGYNGTSWVTIAKLSNADVATSGTKSYDLVSLGFSNINQIKLTFTKVAGNISIDDISVTSGQGSSTAVTNVLTDFEVPSGTSYSVVGLDNASAYSYTVKAANATVSSAESNVIEVSLLTGIANSFVNKYAVRADKNAINLTTSTNEVVRIFDAMGRIVREQAVQAGSTTIALPANQLYIVRIGSYSAKVVVR